MTEQFDTKDMATMQANILHIKEKVDSINKKMDTLNGRVRVTEQSVAVLENEQENVQPVFPLCQFFQPPGNYYKQQ